MKFIVALSVIFLFGCSQTPEEKWVERMASRCLIMHSTSQYNKQTKWFECWKVSMVGFPKLMFKVRYGKRKVS